jgi:hypothetical protein
MAFPGLFIFFGALMLCAVIVLPLLCVIDAATRSSEQFIMADSNKTLRIVLPLVFGILAAIVYLVAIRPKLKAVSA